MRGRTPNREKVEQHQPCAKMRTHAVANATLDKRLFDNIYKGDDLDEFCKEFAIARSFSIPWCPPQNSDAERMWGILLRCTRIMMVEAGINERFWEYAILHAAQLHNVLPSSKLPDEISPYEALKGKQPDVSKFKTWGCTAWHHLHDHERKNKFSPVAAPSIHLGFDPQRNGYIIYLPHQNKITSSYHLTFQESRFMKFRDNEIRDIPRLTKNNPKISQIP